MLLLKDASGRAFESNFLIEKGQLYALKNDFPQKKSFRNYTWIWYLLLSVMGLCFLKSETDLKKKKRRYKLLGSGKRMPLSH